jgi:hypothetical protein
VATAVALAESGGRTDAQGDIGLQDGTWGPSVGLWQIRSLKAEYGKGTPRDASRLTDPEFNARAMASISNGGKNFKPWTTYTSGAYKKQIDKIGVSGIAGGLLGTCPAATWSTSSPARGRRRVRRRRRRRRPPDRLGRRRHEDRPVGRRGRRRAGLVIVGAVHTVSSK